MADQSSINATIDAYLAAFTAGDRGGYVDCFAENAWLEDPVGTPRREGRDDIGAFWDEVHVMPDAIELRPLGLRVVSGPDAALTLQARASIGGQTLVVDVIDVMTFDDAGKITSLRAFFDPAAMRPETG
ncbi:MAG TPA: nuclear transport factor 2 family protein [Acidimicrobiales bacterium]